MKYKEGYRALITYLDVFELFTLKCTSKWFNVYISQSIHQRKLDIYIEQQQSIIDQMLFLEEEYAFSDLLHNIITITVPSKQYAKYYTDLQIGDVVRYNADLHVVKTKEYCALGQRPHICPCLYFTAVDFDTNKFTTSFHSEFYGDGSIHIAHSIDFKLYLGYADIDIIMGPGFFSELNINTLYPYMDMNTHVNYTTWLSENTGFKLSFTDNSLKDWNIDLDDYTKLYPAASIIIYDFVVETDTSVYFKVKIGK